MPRPPDDRQPGYEEQFDALSLFFDIFAHRDRIVISGPPLRNLATAVSEATYALSTGDSGTLHLEDRKGTQRSYLQLSVSADRIVGARLQVSGEGFGGVLLVQPNQSHLFRGRRVLLTLSKNNKLKWIADWITFYRAMHDIDAVLFYDNGSDSYDLPELEATIAAIDGIAVAVVVDWPFKYGPGAGPKKVWDSGFCQASMFEHARFRFLADAAQVINADVDELLVSADGRPAHVHLGESGKGGLLYFGHWIEATSKIEDASFSSYNSFRDRPDCPAKWTIIPAAVPEDAMWTVHGFTGWWPPRSTVLRYRHFWPISTDWKYRRTGKVNGVEDLKVDRGLADAMATAFGSRP